MEIDNIVLIKNSAQCESEKKKNLKKKPLKEQVKKQSYKLSYNQVKNNISWTKKRNKIKKTNFKQRKYILNK